MFTSPWSPSPTASHGFSSLKALQALPGVFECQWMSWDCFEIILLWSSLFLGDPTVVILSQKKVQLGNAGLQLHQKWMLLDEWEIRARVYSSLQFCSCLNQMQYLCFGGNFFLILSICFLNPGKHLASWTCCGNHLCGLTKCHVKLLLWSALKLPLSGLMTLCWETWWMISFFTLLNIINIMLLLCYFFSEC